MCYEIRRVKQGDADAAFCGAQRQLVRWPAAAKRR